MPDLDIRINPSMTDALVQTVEAVASHLGTGLPLTGGIPEEDQDLRTLWIDGLRESQDKDCTILLRLLRHKAFGRGPVPYDEESGEALLRACSAIRLRIQETLLRDVPGEQLEIGEIDSRKLEPDQQRGYACYLFLATLQSIVIQELDPEAEDF